MWPPAESGTTKALSSPGVSSSATNAGKLTVRGLTMAHVDLGDARVKDLLQQTGIDLSALPPVMSTAQLAPGLGITPGALAQDRHRSGGVAYVKIERRVRYLRADVCHYLIANPSGANNNGVA
jgi:hypothetical protein